MQPIQTGLFEETLTVDAKEALETPPAKSKKADPLKNFRNKILCGDSAEIMKMIPNASIDLVVTPPPYNLKNSTGNGMKDGRGGKWKNAALVNGCSDYDDNMPHEEYVAWQRSCLSEAFRIIPEKGAVMGIWVLRKIWKVRENLERTAAVNSAGFR